MNKLYGLLLFFCVSFLHNAEAQKFAKHKMDQKSGIHSEKFPSFTFDGTWCWFSDPRAIFFEGNHQKTYAGWVNSFGDIMIGTFDHQTKEIETYLLHDNLEIDDHNNPALLMDKEGKLTVFFSKHSTGFPIQMYRAKKAENIQEWEDVKALDLNDMVEYQGLLDSYTYQNPVFLSDEDKHYLFWRGADFKPNYSIADENAENWSPGRILILPERIYRNRRPYLKVYSKGTDKIHFAFTDGHPRKEEENSIYYMYYQNGSLHKANGEIIKNLKDAPVSPAETDLVYDASQTKQRAWIWDVAEDEQGNPVIAYARFIDEQNHIYSYARWDGKKWVNSNLINSGKWFPQTPEVVEEREPHYSGGMSLDKEDPSSMYLSVNRDSIFEIEHWQTKNLGKSWKVTSITKGSDKDNVRPFAIRNAKDENQAQVLWMTNTHYQHYTNFHTAIQIDTESALVSNTLAEAEIVEVMRKVADWQLMNPKNHHLLDWHYGAFYTGLMAWYNTSGEERYLNEMINIGQKYNWKLLNDIYHADRLTIAQVFAELYMLKKNPEMLEKVQWVLDMHVDRRSKADVTFKDNPYKFEWWTWCDALYMAPPAFARVYQATGDEKYLQYLDEHWWKTSDYLYSEADSLFYRDDRFFDQRSKNNKKVFWGRGNGWVIAGLARVMDYMPEDYGNRNKFEQQFKEMAYKLLRIQGEDGLWRASLDDPEELPIGESSGSAFFTYALTWGINQNYLPADKFKPAVEKAWKALVNNVNEQGRLGYVQQVAGSPYPFYEDEFQVYASGAFLLAGSEMIKMIGQ